MSSRADESVGLVCGGASMNTAKKKKKFKSDRSASYTDATMFSAPGRKSKRCFARMVGWSSS